MANVIGLDGWVGRPEHRAMDDRDVGHWLGDLLHICVRHCSRHDLLCSHGDACGAAEPSGLQAPSLGGYLARTTLTR
jgi:hypothetical protein